MVHRTQTGSLKTKLYFNQKQQGTTWVAGVVQMLTTNFQLQLYEYITENDIEKVKNVAIIHDMYFVFTLLLVSCDDQLSENKNAMNINDIRDTFEEK